jgi:hypothetical protein
MDINVFPAAELPTVFRVLRTALAPTGALNPAEREFLTTYARITGQALDGAEPQPIAPEAVTIAGQHPRKRLVQLSALAVLLGRPVKPDALAFLRLLARRLETHDPVIDVIGALARGRTGLVRMLAMRRMARVVYKEAYLAEGLPGMLRLFAAMALRTAVNRDRMDRYKRLGLLPDGTLGREYWRFMASEGFHFPGEPAGIPVSVSYHDVSHVLTGHPATPLGEIQQASFQAGNRREDGFFFIQFAVLQFHHGVRITPATPGVLGSFEPRKVLWAIHRGASCPVDMTHQWDYWSLMELPLAEARARCGLLPPLQAGVAC